MAEYIEREALIKQFESNGSHFTYGKKIVDGIVSRINMQPAVDVVEVVRCKNCTHSCEYQENLFCCFYPLTNFSVSPNGYCYNGERRLENENS